jgi:hypothetical protein
MKRNYFFGSRFKVTNKAKFFIHMYMLIKLNKYLQAIF